MPKNYHWWLTTSWWHKLLFNQQYNNHLDLKPNLKVQVNRRDTSVTYFFPVRDECASIWSRIQMNCHQLKYYGTWSIMKHVFVYDSWFKSSWTCIISMKIVLHNYSTTCSRTFWISTCKRITHCLLSISEYGPVVKAAFYDKFMLKNTKMIMVVVSFRIQ
jgi:hypothetical protein